MIRSRVSPQPQQSGVPGWQGGLRLLAVGVALLASLALAGCSTSVVRRGVERRIARRLNSEIGPAKQYRVRIRDTRDTELVLGRARRVEVEGRGILARGRFLVDLVRVTLEDLRYENGDTDFLSIGRSELELEFGEAALNQYLQTYHARYQPEIHLLPGRVSVRIVYKLLGTPTPLSASGRLVVEEGRRLVFEAESADVPFIQDPIFARRFVQDRVNPILDLSNIDFPARIESLVISQGKIAARGSASIRTKIND